MADRLLRDCSSLTQHLWQHEPPTQRSYRGTKEGVADVSAHPVGLCVSNQPPTTTTTAAATTFGLCLISQFFSVTPA